MFIDGPTEKNEFDATEVVRAIGGVDMDDMMGGGLDWGSSEMDSFSSGFHSDFVGCSAVNENNDFGGLSEINNMSFANEKRNTGSSASTNALPLPFDPTAFGLPPLDSCRPESIHKSTSWDERFGMDDFGALSNSSKDGVIPRELRPFPLHHQKYHSFYTSFPACDIIAEMDRLFERSSSLDYSLDSSKNKFKGVIRDGAGEAARFWFVVKFFKGRQPGEILVEMQKRGGCCVGFNYFFKATMVQLAPFVLRRGCVSEGEDKNLDAYLKSAPPADKCAFYKSAASTTTTTTEASVGSTAKTSDTSDLIKNVIAMLDSDAAHTEHRLGINILSSMASTDPLFLTRLNDAIAEKEDFCLAQALQRSFETSSNYIADDACTVVASICEQASSKNACAAQKELRDDIIANLMCPLFAVLESPMLPGDVETAHSKRQIVKALAHLPPDCCVLQSEDKKRCAKSLKRLQAEIAVSENDIKAGVRKVTKHSSSVDEVFHRHLIRAQSQLTT